MYWFWADALTIQLWKFVVIWVIWLAYSHGISLVLHWLFLVIFIVEPTVLFLVVQWLEHPTNVTKVISLIFLKSFKWFHHMLPRNHHFLVKVLLNSQSNLHSHHFLNHQQVSDELPKNLEESVSRFASKSSKGSCFSVVDSHGKTSFTLTYGEFICPWNTTNLQGPVVQSPIKLILGWRKF